MKKIVDKTKSQHEEIKNRTYICNQFNNDNSDKANRRLTIQSAAGKLYRYCFNFDSKLSTLIDDEHFHFRFGLPFVPGIKETP